MNNKFFFFLQQPLEPEMKIYLKRETIYYKCYRTNREAVSIHIEK